MAKRRDSRKFERHKGAKIQFWSQDRTIYEIAAKRQGMSLSAWMRRAADRTVKVEEEELIRRATVGEAQT